MPLKEYIKKRNLKKSGEPKSLIKKSKSKKLIYVIQKHKATNLHYDFRLEINGVLKSWAVPKQPPKAKGIKRLAIQVEDHPLEYATFHGIIPEGNYGSGTVKIWDKGIFLIESKKPNKIVFEIQGKKMKGKYVLVQFTNETKNWLLFRLKDD